MNSLRTWLITLLREWGVDATTWKWQTWPWESREVVRLRAEVKLIREQSREAERRSQRAIDNVIKTTRHITESAAKINWIAIQDRSHRVYRLVIDINPELITQTFFGDDERKYLAQATAAQVEHEIRSGQFIQDARDNEREQREWEKNRARATFRH